jgi:hypothetical protein
MDIHVTDTTSETPKAVSRNANASNSMHISHINYKKKKKKKTVIYFITLINCLNINTVIEAVKFQKKRTTAYTATIPMALLK